MKKLIFAFIGIFLLLSFTQSDNWTNWRGPNRDGIFPESGLLKQWPAEGPELFWSFDGLGAGHSSVGIANDRIFVTGMPDTIGVLYSFDLSGKLLWKKEYGLEWYKNYTGPRSTPIIVDKLLYIESGQGVVYCFDAINGEQKWSVDLLKKFNAENIQWGVSESLLIENDIVYCTPGGAEHNFVALNRFTGETLWTSKGNGEPAAYCSPVIFTHNKTRLIVTMTASSIIGIDAKTGECYWRVEQNQRHKIHANTPVYKDGIVYCASTIGEPNSGMVALKLSDDGKKVEILWRNEKVSNLMGGILLKDNHFYGSVYRKSDWYSVNATTGQEKIISSELGGGVVVFADGLFYCYSEKGQLALVDMSPESFTIKGIIDIKQGTAEHWAHPVIHNKKLYLRHGNSLMIYNIAK